MGTDSISYLENLLNQMRDDILDIGGLTGGLEVKIMYAEEELKRMKERAAKNTPNTTEEKQPSQEGE